MCEQTCFMNVIFKAAFQALHQVGDTTSIFFNDVEFGPKLQVLRLLDVRPQG